MRRARFHQKVEDVHCELGRHVQLPAELADVAHPVGPHVATADVDLLVRSERERLFAHVDLSKRLHDVSRSRAHHCEHGEGRRDVGDGCVGLSTRMVENRLLDSEQVSGAGAGATNHPKLALGNSAHGQVGLDAALVVQPLGVDRTANVSRDRAR